jgi:hypothetical protein
MLLIEYVAHPLPPEFQKLFPGSEKAPWPEYVTDVVPDQAWKSKLITTAEALPAAKTMTNAKTILRNTFFIINSYVN